MGVVFRGGVGILEVKDRVVGLGRVVMLVTLSEWWRRENLQKRH